MKIFFTCALAALGAASTPAWAEALPAQVQAESVSLCGVDDIDALLALLAGEWTTRGAGSIETQSDSFTESTQSVVILSDEGRIASELTLMIGRSLTLERAQTVFDVDRVDDILDTVEAGWIADAVSDTSCGPEGLLQLSAQVDQQPQINGTLTILPYFSDRLVMIAELEMRGDFGFASVTVAELLKVKESSDF